MDSARNEINGWKCGICGKITYCIHVYEGITPMFLGCRETDGCTGTAKSLMYPPPPAPDHVIAAVKWEWYKPCADELRNSDAPTREHVERGGLLLRELTDDGRDALTEYGIA